MSTDKGRELFNDERAELAAKFTAAPLTGGYQTPDNAARIGFLAAEAFIFERELVEKLEEKREAAAPTMTTVDRIALEHELSGVRRRLEEAKHPGASYTLEEVRERKCLSRRYADILGALQALEHPAP